MTVTALDATVAGVDANSYVTLAVADQYFEDRPSSADWVASTDTAKTQCLLAACRDISKLNYAGVMYDETTPQNLPFPRSTDLDVDGDVLLFDAVKEAQMEQAFYLCVMSLSEVQDIAKRGVESHSIGDVSVKYNGGAMAAATGNFGLCMTAMGLLRGWISTRIEVRRG